MKNYRQNENKIPAEKSSKEEIEEFLIADMEQKETFKQKNSPERFLELLEFPKIIIPKEITPEVMKELISKGMIPKSELEDQAYYIGDCRNAIVSRWDAKAHKFTYMRSKFDNTFPENINHPEDDNGFDLFTPFKKVEPNEDEIIQKDTRTFLFRTKPKSNKKP